MTDAALSEAPARPGLTLPSEEAAVLRAAYEAADVILEYGSGGSTAMAAEMPGKTVFSVESDAEWLAGLQAWFARTPPKADVRLHHADIGPTGKWGMPKGNAAWARFHDYPLSVWDREDFAQPDVVLIDGRFRAACLLAVLFRTTKPVTVLFDDWVGREEYRVVEHWIRPAGITGRMARFEAGPTPIEAADLPRIMKIFARRR